MAEDPGAEKTLPASGMKKQRARMQGNIPKSQDLSAAVALIIALVAMLMLGSYMLNRLLLTGAYYLGHANELTLAKISVQSFGFRAGAELALVIAPFLLVMLVGGIAANLFQVGFLFTTEPLQIRLDRLNPFTGLGRFFSLRSIVEFLKSLAKLSVVTFIVWLAMRSRLEEFPALIALNPMTVLIAVSNLVVTVWWRIAVAVFIIGLLDYWYQKWQYEKDLRMTPQEAKQEAKELEGDPLVKRKVRQMQRQMAMRRMMGEVPKAEVVITNPTHYAVALRYDLNTMSAPVLIAKGMRLQADRIRGIASEHGVPIVQRPELARALYHNIEINQTIPEHLFRAVAEVLSFVYQIDRRQEKLHERAEMMNNRVA